MAFGEGVRRGLRRAKAAVLKDGAGLHAYARRRGEAQTPAAHAQPAPDLPGRTWSKCVVTAPERDEVDIEQHAASSRDTQVGSTFLSRYVRRGVDRPHSPALAARESLALIPAAQLFSPAMSVFCDHSPELSNTRPLLPWLPQRQPRTGQATTSATSPKM